MGTPAGIRNRNPLNLRAGERWQGLAEPHEMTPEQRRERRFAVFRSPEWGIRAAVRVLQTYRTKYGIDTVRGIVSRWAPAGDNNPVAAYVAAVSSALGVDPDQSIDTADTGTLMQLIPAMIRFENGMQPYPAETIMAGIALAGLAEPKLKPMAVSKEQAIGTAGVLGSAGVILNEVRGTMPELLEWVGPYLPWLLLALFAAVLVNRWVARYKGKR